MSEQVHPDTFAFMVERVRLMLCCRPGLTREGAFALVLKATREDSAALSETPEQAAQFEAYVGRRFAEVWDHIQRTVEDRN